MSNGPVLQYSQCFEKINNNDGINRDSFEEPEIRNITMRF